MRGSTGWVVAPVALLALASLTACDATAAATPGPPSSASTPSVHPSMRAAAPTATPTRGPAELLAQLPVKGRAAMTGYSREQFGDPWTDTDGNGCDTRDDVLARDLVHLHHAAGSRCEVGSGALLDPYTATTIAFARGDGEQVDIDHVVALGNAWVTGAFRWTAGRRLQFANDPANLLAVDASANRQKGDGDAATWLPRNKSYRCAYVARQIGVKAAYGLWVTPPERDAMQRVLARCSDEPTPAHSTMPAESTVPAQPSTPGESSTRFANCDAARAGGAAPVHAGDPGYSRTLDRDGDGTGCE